MKILITIYFILTVSILAQDSTNTKIKSGLLTLKVTGIENNDGNMKIALSDSEKDYTIKGKAFRTAAVQIENNIILFSFNKLPFGMYAIKIFHDENNNGELDTNFLGIPTEDYGFSNNAKGSFGPASWEDAKFNFDKDSSLIEINLDE